jgi:phosphoglycolate phosphatase
MLKLIVLDCDGVMFDSKKSNILYYNFLLAHYGMPPMKTDEEDFVHMSNVTESVRHIFRHYRQPSLEEVHIFRRQTDYGPFLQYMEMEPDLRTFLEATRSEYHLAISTNRTNTMIPLLRSYGLENYFGMVMTAETAKRPKPAPDGLLEILNHFKCRPEEAIFVGDSIIDEQHAAACNVPLIAFKNRNLQARYHVGSFMEILNLPPFGERKCPPRPDRVSIP